MSTLKPTQQKFALDARVFEIINSTFPEFKCTITDIKFPKKDFVVSFYTFLLEQLNLNLQKVMIAPVENQMQGESHPEIFAETLQLSNLSQVLKTILNMVQSRDGLQFGLEDLMEPNFTRNTAFMFNLLNFFNFADSRVHELVGKLEVIGQRKGEMEKLLEAREQLSRELNQRALRKVKRQDAVKEIKTKRSEVDEMKRETASLEQMSEKRRAELEDTKRHQSRIQSEIAQLRENYKALEAQQVQSPDVLKSNYKHSQDKLKDVKQHLEQAQETAKEKKKAMKLFESVEKDLEVRLALLNDIVDEAKTVKEFDKQLENLKSDIKTKLDETEASQSQLKGLKNDLVQLSSLLTNLQLQREKTKSSMKEIIRHLQEEKKTLESQLNSEIAETLRDVDQMQTEVNDLVEENHKCNQFYEKLYAELMQKEQLFITTKTRDIDTFVSELDSERNP